MARTSRALALALTVAGATGFLLPAAPRFRAGALGAASCQLEAELGVVAANNQFYDAIRDGDVHAMAALLHPAEGECSIIMPGQRPIVGRGNVLSSWDMALGGPVHIEPSDVTVVCAAGEVAWVHCLMRISVNSVAADGADADPFAAETQEFTAECNLSPEEIRRQATAAPAMPPADEEDVPSFEVRARLASRARARAPLPLS